MDIRCAHKLHGRIIEPGEAVVEFKCSSRFCGAAEGIVILHRFSTTDGHLLETKMYKDTPQLRKAGARNGTR